MASQARCVLRLSPSGILHASLDTCRCCYLHVSELCWIQAYHDSRVQLGKFDMCNQRNILKRTLQFEVLIDFEAGSFHKGRGEWRNMNGCICPINIYKIMVMHGVLIKYVDIPLIIKSFWSCCFVLKTNRGSFKGRSL